MLCANPDLVASQIEFYGKPFAAIYQLALDLLDNPKHEDVLAIGDAYATDIVGADNAGLDSHLIAAGIHHQNLNPLSSATIELTATGFPLPNYASEYFQW
jgi:ribonucleotide monophosphatase NagD (HAD superfamily)